MLRHIVVSAAVLMLLTGASTTARSADVSAAVEAQQAADAPAPRLLAEIAGWLAENFDLPEARELPRVELAPAAKMAAVRRGSSEAGGSIPPEFGRGAYALYDDGTRTIYLEESWTGGTQADVSVLVHEMVHHLQNLAGLKYNCPQERERLAYRAQIKWLEQRGKSLFDEFEINPFSLLVRINCMS